MRIRATALMLVAVTAGMLLASATLPASALTIIRTYVEPGQQFESGHGQVTAGDAPRTVVGGGNLVETFNAAADAWERAIRDDHTVAIQFGWSPIPVGSGVHAVVSQGGAPHRVTRAIVYFDNDGSTKWFLDRTPGEHSEYSAMTECFTSFSGSRINSGRLLSSAMGPAEALDLSTIAKHEIGHAIGLTTWNAQWAWKNAGQGIVIKSPRPFPGSMIPTTLHAHLTVSGALMGGVLVSGQRKLLSVVDVVVVAELGEFMDLNLSPDSVALDTAQEGC